MKIMSGFLDDAYMAWLASAVGCCASSRKQAPMRGEDETPSALSLPESKFLTEPKGIEKPMRIEHHQPRLIPPPIPEEQERPTTRGREWVSRTKSFASRASSRGSFSVRRQLNTYNGPRRPRIGAPQDFRHVEDAMPLPPRRKERFRPLELSIYMPENQLSPILPHFGAGDELSFPPDNSKELPQPPEVAHSRSGSALSFRVPRKPVRSASGSSSQWTANFKPRPDSLSAQELLAALSNDLPRAPPKARLRALTEPPAYERVKSALHEKYELEQRLRDIDVIIEERKSVYLNSRPTSQAASRPSSIYADSEGMHSISTHFHLSQANRRSTEPMPPPPPFLPSFADRASSPIQRPKTAPSKQVHIPTRLKSFTEASAAFTSHPPSPYEPRLPSSLPPPPPPPLPLVLQSPPHPLRKKKSFSRVSHWLFPTSPVTTSSHSRNISMDTVTNTPKPITSRDGFYQCVDLQRQVSDRTSVSTVSTLSSISSLDEPNAPMAWTPESSPGGVGSAKMRVEVMIKTLEMDEEMESAEVNLARTLEQRKERAQADWAQVPVKVPAPGRNSVGVAF